MGFGQEVPQNSQLRQRISVSCFWKPANCLETAIVTSCPKSSLSGDERVGGWASGREGQQLRRWGREECTHFHGLVNPTIPPDPGRQIVCRDSCLKSRHNSNQVGTRCIKPNPLGINAIYKSFYRWWAILALAISSGV